MYRSAVSPARSRRYIDVIVVLDTSYSNMDIAAERAKHPDILSEDERWTHVQLAFYNSFLDSAADAIQKYFTISDEGQSGYSYSYYMYFSTNIEDWTVRYITPDRFRPRARNKTISSKNDKSHRLFRQIVIGPDKEFTSYPQAVKAIDAICKGISEGDLEIISKSYENTEI